MKTRGIELLEESANLMGQLEILEGCMTYILDKPDAPALELLDFLKMRAEIAREQHQVLATKMENGNV